MNDFDREVEQNLPLVTYVLQKCYHKWTEDMFQNGCVGLIKGVQTFDENKKLAKSTYYCVCIKNEIAQEYRTATRKKRGGDMDTISLNINVKDNIELSELIPSTQNIEDELIEQETKLKLYELINELDHVERTILTYTFGLFDEERKTQQEIGEILGQSQVYVCRKLKKILIKMKGKMENKNKTL